MSYQIINHKKCELIDSEHVVKNGKTYLKMKYRAIKDNEEFDVFVEYIEPQRE